MAGFVSRWDRYYPKAFEAIANHRYASVGVSVETNLLGPRGRGTLPRRLRASVKAARWAAEQVSEPARPAKLVRPDARRPAGGTLVAYGSSERQVPSDGSVTLVLTDPPYFDDVQYGELAELFLVWARAIKLLPGRVALDLRKEAVPNAVRGTTARDYERLLKRIFRETRRTLAPDGRLVLTYHNRDLSAWHALGRALSSAGFSPAALAVVDAENDKDHPKRMSRAFTKDLVIECRLTVGSIEPQVVWSTDDSQDRELIAAGLALASASGTSLSDFSEAFRLHDPGIPEAERRIVIRGLAQRPRRSGGD